MASIVSYKPISENLYFSRYYIEDIEKMAFYEACLKKVNTNLSLNTGINELPKIFSIIEKWDGILNKRLSIAPSKVLATKLFKDELLASVEYDEMDEDNIKNDNKYWNKYRKVAYTFYLKGQNITLQYLGYLLLRNVVENVDGFEVIQRVSNMFDVEGAIISLAEGAALAEYLHCESVPVTKIPPITTKSKLDFAYPKLEAIVLQLASLRGYESPIAYLDELLNDVKQFDNFDFLCNFYLNIHQICKENASSFWCDRHRVAITKWLKKSPIITQIFDTIWENVYEKEEIQSDETKPTITAYAIMHVYLEMYNGKAVTQHNKNELAKLYGYKSGDQLRNDFTLYQNEDKRLDINTTNKRSANTHLQRFKTILPLLQKENSKAYEKAKQDFQKLKELYSKHY